MLALFDRKSRNMCRNLHGKNPVNFKPTNLLTGADLLLWNAFEDGPKFIPAALT